MVQKTPLFQGTNFSTTSTAWTVGSQWSPNGVPAAADDVTISGGPANGSSTVAFNSTAGTLLQLQANSITLDNQAAKLVVAAGGALGSVALNGGTIRLAAGSIRFAATPGSTASINNSTIQLAGGTLAGTGVLDTDILQGVLSLSPTASPSDTVPLNTLTIANKLTLDAAQRVALVAPTGSTITTASSSSGIAILDSGVVLAGTAGSAGLTVIEADRVPLLLGSGLGIDVVGPTVLNSTFTEPNGTLALTNAGTVTVGPGGSLVLGDNVTNSGAFRIYSGSLSLSSDTVIQAAAYPIQMDDGAAVLNIKSGQSVSVKGFRLGDSIIVAGTGATVASTVAASPGATTLNYGSGTISLLGTVLANSTYTLTPDGAGGTLVTTNALPAASIAFTDQSVNATQGGSHALDFVGGAAGTPSYLQWQYIDAGPDTVAISSAVPNCFIRGGSGTKAIQVASGQNVLDGGTGSSFLTGGTGNDTFFVDTFYGTPVADTIRNFHAGDAVTVWGYTAGSNSYAIDATGGAPGSTGATIRVLNSGGGVAATVTFTGMSLSQVSQLQVATGTQAAGSYLYFYNPGV